MLLLPEYKGPAEEMAVSVLLQQWLYDSHLWEQVEGLKMRQCKWCQAESTVNLKVTKGQPFCPKNPIIEQIFENVKKIIKDTPA